MAPQRKAPPHYLRGNETTWTPPQIISLDTETRWREDTAGQTHIMRLWAARLDCRRPDNAGWTGHDTAWGKTCAQLAAQVSEWCKGEKCVWLFAHNLSFDLTVSKMPAEMAKLGWTVTDHAAGSETPWLRMKKGSCNLTLADSWGWLRQSITGCGVALNVRKPDLPENSASVEDWLIRCLADVEILAESMLALLDWWDKEQLGRWSVTGSHSGWNVMRHLTPRKRMVIMTDDAGIDADRAAIYGGRRECFTWGNIPGGPFTEHDFSAAYPRIAANLSLPAKRMFSFPSMPLTSPLVRGEVLGIIAEVEIETDVPRWPCRVGGRVWYPVGRFTTVMAGPEIAEALRLGCLRRVGPGHAHAMGWHLKPWADWILAAQYGEMPGVPAVAIPMIKHWGRAVIGKFAARGFSKEAYGDALDNAWGYEPIWDIAAQAHGAIVSLGGKRWKCLATSAGENCYPAVLAYIESHTRVRLSRVIDAAGPGQVTCCDTDGVTGPDSGGLALAVQGADTWPLKMRPKGTYLTMNVLGPQHLIKDGKRSYSGMPGSAVQGADGKYYAMTWPRLAWQLREHVGDGYRRPMQAYTVGASYASGWVAIDGTVLPVELALDGQGATSPVPWPLGRHAAAGRQLAGVQAPRVEQVFGR